MNARACDAHHVAQDKTTRAWLKTCAIIKCLPELLKRIETLEKALTEKIPSSAKSEREESAPLRPAHRPGRPCWHRS